jgi:hypothetical protein
MNRELDVGSWVIVRRGCPIAFCVNGEQIEFRLGSQRDGVDFVFEPDALRAFVEASEEVLSQLTRV